MRFSYSTSVNFEIKPNFYKLKLTEENQSLVNNIQNMINNIPKDESRYPIYMGIPDGLTEPEKQQLIEMGEKLANIDIEALLGVKE